MTHVTVRFLTSSVPIHHREILAATVGAMDGAGGVTPTSKGANGRLLVNEWGNVSMDRRDDDNARTKDKMVWTVEW